MRRTQRSRWSRPEDAASGARWAEHGDTSPSGATLEGWTHRHASRGSPRKTEGRMNGSACPHPSWCRGAKPRPRGAPGVVRVVKLCRALAGPIAGGQPGERRRPDPCGGPTDPGRHGDEHRRVRRRTARARHRNGRSLLSSHGPGGATFTDTTSICRQASDGRSDRGRTNGRACGSEALSVRRAVTRGRIGEFRRDAIGGRPPSGPGERLVTRARHLHAIDVRGVFPAGASSPGRPEDRGQADRRKTSRGPTRTGGAPGGGDVDRCRTPGRKSPRPSGGRAGDGAAAPSASGAVTDPHFLASLVSSRSIGPSR